MARNLLAKGFSVIGFDMNPEMLSILEADGIQRADNIVTIANEVDVVVLCLPNQEASRQVAKELLTEGARVATIIETSTLSPAFVTELGKSVEESGKKFLSAPMIGGKGHAQNGTIEFLAEGKREVLDELREVFDAMGSKVRFMGEIPSATRAKLVFNLSRYANLAVGVETHRLLEKYDANIPAIYEFMSEQSLDNFGQVWREDLKDMMTGGVPFRPSQVPKKDLALLKDMATDKGLDDSLIEAIRRTYLSMEE